MRRTRASQRFSPGSSGCTFTTSRASGGACAAKLAIVSAIGVSMSG
jgi:hypothetical protein